MKILRNQVLGIIPARGGSKAIPLKNLYDFMGKPLIWYVSKTFLKSMKIDRVICTTDDNKIANYCKTIGIDVWSRPEELSGDSISVIEVLIDLLETISQVENCLPEIIVLGQPTSPFVSVEHIDKCISALMADTKAASSQTVIEITHHNHYINQRKNVDGYIEFIHEKERFEQFNKQKKEKTYALGNLVVTRTEALFKQRQVFAKPSIPIEIHPIYGFDLDSYTDAEIGECYFQHELIKKLWND